MKYFLNPDVRDSASALNIFVKRLCFRLLVFKSHVTNYRYGFYETSDLPAITGYIPLKTRRLLSLSPKTILISALGFGEIINSLDMIGKIQTLSSYQIIILSRQPQMVRKMYQSKGLSVIALPYPFFASRRIISWWLNKLRPCLILCVENMVQLKADMLELAREKHKTSVLLVNAHAFRKSNFLWQVLEDTKQENERKFRCLDMAGVVSEGAKKYLIGYGVPENRMIMINNLKFDAANLIVQQNEREMLRRQLGISDNEKVLICGSVHLGEEIILLNAFKNIISRPGLKNIRLIIAPREFYDLNKIAASIKSLGFHVVLKTACSETPLDSSAIVLVDTLGELKILYSIADVVIVAGSMLSDLLGHNPIEPAIMGKPVIAGPYTTSFNDVMDKFLDRKAIIKLQNTEDLADQAAYLFEHPEIREKLGLLAKKIVEECGGATAKYLDIIGGLLPE